MPTNQRLSERIKSRIFSTMRSFMPPNPAFTGNAQTWLLPPKRADFSKVEPFDNGATVTCLKWTARNFKQGKFTIYREQANGKRKPQAEHPLSSLLKKPNEFYSYYHLMAATLLSFDLNGNAYWLKKRGGNGFGFPEELWYVPHWMMRPHTEPDSQGFIDYYVYTVRGTQYAVDHADVVHFRNDLDPNDVRLGYSGLRAELSSVFSDEESGIFAASIMKNMGIPGVVISPGDGMILEAEQAKAVIETYQKRTTGTERGKPIILDYPAKIDQIGLSPVDLQTVEQRMFFEQRICAALGISPAVVFLPSGSKNAQSYNNLVNLRKAAFEENLVPRWQGIAETVQEQLLNDFPNPTSLICEYDLSSIQSLKENENDKAKREGDKFQRGGQTWNEYRTALGMETNVDGDWLLLPNNVAPITLERVREQAEKEIEATQPSPNSGDDQPEDPEDDKVNGSKKKSFAWEGLQLKRKPTAHEEAQALIVAAAQNSAKASVAVAVGRARLQLVEQGLERLAATVDIREGLQLTLGFAEQTELTAAIQRAYESGRDTLRDFDKSERKSLFDALSRIVRGITAAIVARVTGRLIDEYARAITRGATPAEAVEAVRAEMESEPAAYVQEIAAGAAFEAIASGRFDELLAVKKPGDRFIYSAILDTNTCEPCEDDDLKEADDPAKLPHAPNSKCRGRWRCRCMIVIARD